MRDLFHGIIGRDQKYSPPIYQVTAKSPTPPYALSLGLSLNLSLCWGELIYIYYLPKDTLQADLGGERSVAVIHGVSCRVVWCGVVREKVVAAVGGVAWCGDVVWWECHEESADRPPVTMVCLPRTDWLGCCRISLGTTDTHRHSYCTSHRTNAFTLLLVVHTHPHTYMVAAHCHTPTQFEYVTYDVHG